MEIIDLDKINKAQIRRAGQRYAPSVDPNAPNLPIDSVLLPIAALAGDEHFVRHVEELRKDLLEGLRWQRSQVSKYFKRVNSTPDSIADALKDLATSAPGERLASSRLIRTRSSRAQTRLGRMANSLFREELAGLDEKDRSRVQSEQSDLLNLSSSLDAVVEFTETPAFSAITSNCLLVRRGMGHRQNTSAL